MKTKKKRNNIKYSYIIVLGSLFLFGAIIFRLSQLALSNEIDGVNLKKLASKRTTKTQVISAQRGSIYTSDGDVLAQNISSYKLIAYLDAKRTDNPKKPQHVVDKEKTAKELAPILGMEEAEVLTYLNKQGVYQTEFGVKGKNLNELEKQKIDDLNLPGLDFYESFKRYYPKGDFASYVVGYAKDKEEDGDIKGEMGIEKYYDKLLRGEDGSITYQKDLRGYQIADTTPIIKEATQGKDIYLTIDNNVQFFIQQALINADVDYDFEWFHITIMDAKTGAILGTATSPSFDPNTRNITNYLDTMISLPYEPGSTMKTFTYMAAMENGVYDGAETYKSGVYVAKDGTEIGDWKREGWGIISYDKGYAMSSNVGVINIINRHMNSMMLRQYFRKIGFGRKTGISLPGEQAGKLNFKYETEIFNAGFGQGVTTTPIQNVKALTPLTNSGVLLKPYIVSKIIDSSTGEIILENNRTEEDTVASVNTVNKMLSLMDDCVNGEGNTGASYRVDNGQLIGKTGTAQIANENGGGYLTGDEDIIASFSGIYPKSNPHYIIYASIKKPSGGNQKPIHNAIKEIVANLSKYYDTPENTSTKINNYKLFNYVNKKVDNVKATLSVDGIKFSIIGNGDRIVKQFPEAKSMITTDDTVYLITNDNNLTVPNVMGLSSRAASNLLTELGLKVKLEGVGYVVNQSIPEGTSITTGMEITLNLSPRFTVGEENVQ